METCESTKEPPTSVSDGPTVDSENNVQNNESTESFQKFMYKLFEKNGILNDLRAYLRGHIVNVLRSAQTGDVPSCQKHFTERLEHPSQALNMLIAEYFLRMEFSYSLSVFVAEIPLANMVFEFARSLMENGDQTEGLRFTQQDIWAILNYLGIKCDSDYATNIVDMYKTENMSLLQCLLKCTPVNRNDPDNMDHESADESLSSISLDYLNDKVRNVNKNKDKCKHTATCKICRNRFSRIREEYKEKKHFLAKTQKGTNLNSSNLENLMRNISDMERSLIDEMFDQLKSVYETEVDMMKAEEDKKVKRSLATHSLQLQQKRDEMEESFKFREQELERNLQQKKKFLWGLAKALREQHAQISRAQLAVRHEARRLCVKQDNLKSQLIDAEQTLIKRAEEMRSQISNELFILEGHLESMKRERETIIRERCQLEQLRAIKETNCNVTKIDNLEENADTRIAYFLKNEFSILKKYLETTKEEPKCFMERSTLTDLNDISSKLSFVLNNEHDRDEKRGVTTPNQLVNDFKKQKNVNFSQSNLDEIYRERSRDRSRSSASSDAGDVAVRYSFERDRDRDRYRDTIRRLRDENERLKALARQQREHVEGVWSQPARAPAPAPAPRADQPRPHTAPDLFYIHSSNSSPTRPVTPNTFGWRKGAGEEISVFTNVPPRIVLPGDPVPFIGVVRDRHNDNRRQLISQWRALRRRMSPVGLGRLRTCTAISTARDRVQRPSSAGPSVKSSSPERAQADKPFVSMFQPDQSDNTFPPSTRSNIEEKERPRTSVCMYKRKVREKSPKSLLREAKEKLRSNITKDNPQTARGRDKSPNAVLREAKLRLRKLEIEAEAVEKSYRDFRRRQSEMKTYSYYPANEEAVVTKDVDNLDVKRSALLHMIDFNETPETSNSHNKEYVKSKTDMQTYIREYQSAFETHFVNGNTVVKKAKPIPELLSPQITRKTKEDLKSRLNNFLETPLTEFRMLYQSRDIPQRPLRIDDAQKDPADLLFKNSEGDNVKENSIQREEIERDAIKAKTNKVELEFEILKHNLNKIYNLQDEPAEIPQLSDEENITPEKTAMLQESEKNLLKIEVESGSEIQRMTTESEPQNVLLVVETSVIENEEHSEDDKEVMSTNMTILISHKRSDVNTDVERAKSPEKGRRSVSPEQAARLTRNDVLDAIFHADTMKEASSIEMQLELSKEKEDSITEVERHPDDYPDDFSADVDNYNSRTESENQSPISLPKEDSFWDT